jgi:2-polyprenyl-3-methyl-5-hydroxy-6-metoxy-1,4-benzoquinol methylase
VTEDPLVDVTTCQLCGSDKHRVLFEESPYSVLRCLDCGLVFVTPRLAPDALQSVYGERYWKSDSPKTQGYSDYAADEPLYLKTFRRRLGALRLPAGRKLKVLDVGCAAGFFLRVMREQGHDVYGVELSAAIAQHAKHHLGDERIHVGTLDTLPADRFGAGSFDLITMWDVVEHVTDPQALLRQAKSLLSPEGSLLIETQNVDSAFAVMLGRRWHHYKHQEHLYHFNPQTIQRLLEQTGFELVRNTASYGGKYVSLGFIAERAARLHRSISLLLKPLALASKANLYLNFRDEMVVLARPSTRAAEPSGRGARSASAPAAAALES